MNGGGGEVLLHIPLWQFVAFLMTVAAGVFGAWYVAVKMEIARLRRRLEEDREWLRQKALSADQHAMMVERDLAAYKTLMAERQYVSLPVYLDHLGRLSGQIDRLARNSGESPHG